jgi:hypothetical protein
MYGVEIIIDVRILEWKNSYQPQRVEIERALTNRPMAAWPGHVSMPSSRWLEQLSSARAIRMKMILLTNFLGSVYCTTQPIRHSVWIEIIEYIGVDSSYQKEMGKRLRGGGNVVTNALQAAQIIL